MEIDDEELSTNSDESSTTREIQRLKEKLILLRKNMDADDRHDDEDDKDELCSSSNEGGIKMVSNCKENTCSLVDVTNKKVLPDEFSTRNSDEAQPMESSLKKLKSVEQDTFKQRSVINDADLREQKGANRKSSENSSGSDQSEDSNDDATSDDSTSLSSSTVPSESNKNEDINVDDSFSVGTTPVKNCDNETQTLRATKACPYQNLTEEHNINTYSHDEMGDSLASQSNLVRKSDSSKASCVNLTQTTSEASGFPCKLRKSSNGTDSLHKQIQLQPTLKVIKNTFSVCGKDYSDQSLPIGNATLAVDEATSKYFSQSKTSNQLDRFGDTVDASKSATESTMCSQSTTKTAQDYTSDASTHMTQTRSDQIKLTMKPKSNHERGHEVDETLEKISNEDLSTVDNARRPTLDTLVRTHDEIYQSQPGVDHGLEVQTFPEIHHSLYAPPIQHEKAPPVIHEFSLRTRPLHTRPRIPITQIFRPPLNLLWTNKYDAFNQMQSEIANLICHSDDNVVVSAPTGAGKSTIFEMAIARFVEKDLQASHHSQRHGIQRVSKFRKIVYIAPSKALCEERFEDWSSRISKLNYGIELAMITGDGEPGDCFRDLVSAHFILTTPEKWDSISRRWTENFFLMACVKLVMIDEVHLLGDDTRGCCLEAIITRMKSIQRAARSIQVSNDDLHTSSYANTTPEAISSCMRVVAVSATLPNIADVADFLDANEAYTFDESYRPVPLSRHVVGLGYVGKNQFKFWNGLDRHVPELIQRFSNNKQTLVFCHTKKETERLAGLLLSTKNNNFRGQTKGAKAFPKPIQEYLANGVAYHHAGIQASDRRLVEQAFAEGKLRCLCATSTLAVGVNLPAHLVIIKGTMTWRGGGLGYQEIEAGALLQMIGRAGRPGLDTSGTAIIMTDNKSKSRIERLAQGLGAAESKLHLRLTDVINVEISQRVVTNLQSALQWIKTTYLSTRLLREEKNSNDVTAQDRSIDSQLLQLCTQAISRLCEIGIVAENERDNEISPLAGCHIMSQNMVQYEAMGQLTSLPFDATQCQILHTLSRIDLIQYPVRRHEKSILNKCHESIKFKLDGPPKKIRIQTPSQKTFVLLQASIGQLFLEDYTLRQEMSSLIETCCRTLSALQEFSIRGSRNGQVALQSWKLRRSLFTSLWGDSSGVLNQIAGVGQRCTANLRFNGIISFADVLSSSNEEIGRASGRGEAFGKELRTLVSRIVMDKMKLKVTIAPAGGPAEVLCDIIPYRDTRNFNPNLVVPQDIKKPTLNYTLLAYTDRPGSCLIFRDKITGPASYRFPCPRKFGKLFVHLVASMVGLDEEVELDGNCNVVLSSFVGQPKVSAKSMPKKSRPSRKESIARQSATSRAFYPDDEAVNDTRRTPTKAPQKSNIPKLHRPSNLSTSSDHSSERDSAETSSLSTVTPSSKQASSRQKSMNSAVITPLIRTPSGDAKNHPCIPFGSGTNLKNRALEKQQYIPAAKKPLRPVTDQYDQTLNQTSSIVGTEGKRNSFVATSAQAVKKRRQIRAWNEEKRKQHKSQRRAFTNRRDNPFMLYQHDPNNAESYLEALSSERNEPSVIPARELEAIDRSVAAFRRSNFMAIQRKRKTRRHLSPYRRISDKDLLRIKAEEQEAYSKLYKSRHLPAITTPSRQPRMPVDHSQEAGNNPGYFNPFYGQYQENSEADIMTSEVAFDRNEDYTRSQIPFDGHGFHDPHVAPTTVHGQSTCLSPHQSYPDPMELNVTPQRTCRFIETPAPAYHSVDTVDAGNSLGAHTYEWKHDAGPDSDVIWTGQDMMPPSTLAPNNSYERDFMSTGGAIAPPTTQNLSLQATKPDCTSNLDLTDIMCHHDPGNGNDAKRFNDAFFS